METQIKIRDLNVYYNKVHALKDINLDLPRGQITVIVGPSGCGKSTLLKTLNRFHDLADDTQVTGHVELDGVDLYAPDVEVTEVRTKVGLIAQRPFPLPMSIFENVAYGMRIHKLARGKELRDKVKHYLEVAGLWDEVKGRLNTPARDLSIGQQQRLCLARGLAVEPEVILGDEPTSSLDPISAKFIEERLEELKKDYTVVLVSHVLRQARHLADYLVFMYLGEVVEAGPAEQVLSAPKNDRTRAYLQGEFY
ncbi:MAG: phosphate ABC transporter ATP-binding protein [Anaerolineales bacterium]|nr:MAG: phosphate ABC transporter ATP-binding protein [Anaerolineales bacterium]